MRNAFRVFAIALISGTALCQGPPVTREVSGHVEPLAAARVAGQLVTGFKSRGAYVYALLSRADRRDVGSLVLLDRFGNAVSHLEALSAPLDFDVLPDGRILALGQEDGARQILYDYGPDGTVRSFPLDRDYVRIATSGWDVILLSNTGDLDTLTVTDGDLSRKQSYPEAVLPPSDGCCGRISAYRFLMDALPGGRVALLERATMELSVVDLATGEVTRNALKSAEVEASMGIHDRQRQELARLSHGVATLATPTIGLAMTADKAGGVWVMLSPVDERAGAYLVRFSESGAHVGTTRCKWESVQGGFLRPVFVSVGPETLLLAGRGGGIARFDDLPGR